MLRWGRFVKSTSTKYKIMKIRSKSKKGFSLIEILVTIAIAATLAALVIPNLLGARGQADAGMAQTLENQLNGTFAQWRSLGGSVTGAATGLDVITLLTSVENNPDTEGGASDSTGIVNSSSIRTQLNDPGGFAAVGSDDNVLNYGDFTVTYTAGGAAPFVVAP